MEVLVGDERQRSAASSWHSGLFDVWSGGFVFVRNGANKCKSNLRLEKNVLRDWF